MLAELKRQGKIRHLGVSNVTPRQVAKARSVTEIVCVQNHYNLAHRDDDSLIDDLAQSGIAYTPFIPLGGFTPLQSSTGTSSVGHLRENLAAAALRLPSRVVADLDSIATG